ncbi:MAG: hypothetical protein WCJ93_11070 [Methanomicrobiales archaeon]
MGFDLGGLAPENADGECFDTDISGWMPLAEYVLFTCEDLFLEGETECWFSNDGQVVSAETARAIGDRLLELIADGSVEKYNEEFYSKIGGPYDEPDEEPNETDREEDTPIQKGKIVYKGKGTAVIWTIEYEFDVAELEKFAKFCLASGGFEIC